MNEAAVRKIVFLSILMFSFWELHAGAPHGPVELAGDVIQVALPVYAAFYSLDSRDWAGSWALAESYGMAMGLTHSLKELVSSPRPKGNDNSFPSGHTACAFSGAAYLQMRYGWHFGFPAYLLASYVAFSRVYAERHWPIDVIWGAGIGIISNVIFTRPAGSVTFSPMAFPQGGGFSVNIEF